MVKVKTGAIGAIAAAMIATSAMAGQTQPFPVQVDLVAGSAQGDMVSARTDKDDEVFIGCGTRNFDDGAGNMFSLAFCQGRDAEGDQATCFTQNPEMVRTVREINDTSFLTFAWTDDGAGNLTCTNMGYSTQSFYLGKEIKGN